MNETITQLEFVNGVLTDVNNNTASVAYWGSEDRARRALASLSRCSRCADCVGCSDCSRCSDCADCVGCTDCVGCVGCAGCVGCSRCSRCSRCSGCVGCADMAPQKTEPKAIPVIPNIHQAIYAAASQPGQLEMEQWHTCETAHCRAGWVVHLAGPAGYELERRTTTLFAASQIYKASGYPISPVRFFDTNEKAMADVKRLAGVE
jgi:hypothetical protein